MIKEFREFLSQGSALDLAIGVIIGAAFGAIVSSLVNDLITPLLGIILGGMDFSGLVLNFGKANFAYGKFIQAVINFVLIGFVLFMIIKAMNKFREKKEDVPVPPTPDQELLREIRDLLKSGK